ncbi:MAG: DUF4352 domain-containing protein [Halobacteriota archaeon]
MISEMNPSAFVNFLADIWTINGWRTTVHEREQDGWLIAGERRGRRGLLLALPNADQRVTGQHLQRFVSTCAERNVNHPVVATRGTFSDDAERIAAANGVHVITSEDVSNTVKVGGFEEILEQHSDQKSSAEGIASVVASLRRVLPNVADASAVLRRVGTARSPGGLDRSKLTRVAALVFVVVLGVGGTVAPGLAIPSVSVPGSSSDDIAVSAVSATGVADASLEVAWRARTGATVTTGNDTTYAAPTGEQFVVLHLDVTNTGSTPTTLDADQVLVESEGQRYAHQPLQGVSGFEVGILDPNESTSAWLAFSVPRASTSATVLVHPTDSSSRPSVRFVHDHSVSASVSTR